jgi:hypothetical protein
MMESINVIVDDSHHEIRTDVEVDVGTSDLHDDEPEMERAT